ncbi:MAG: tetratricopeptide repeat protein [Acidobacteria bacterium]|nr:tetratricopeptide repeat protein [Acidobacteriota bacterium]
MTTDRQSNPLPGATPAAAARFDEAVRSFNIYRGDPLARLDEAVAESPAFASAHLFKAFILGLATEPAATVEARRIADDVRALPLDEREASQLAALDALNDGNWVAAANALDFHNMRHPRDLVALQVGHLMDFYRGSARELRDRIARALPHWSDGVPGLHTVLGMYSFGLEETGDYARAEEVGRRAIDLEPLDSWAHHAVAHVMEMQGRAEDGIGWMIAREPHWSGDDNFFKVHNWWHRALYHLDLGQAREVLALYDGPIRGGRSRVALDLVDASALLWRLSLCGHDVGTRWTELADCWDDHADGRLYPFNDLHAVMAYLGAGRDAAVDRVVAALGESARGAADTARWARAVGLPLVTGFVAFWRGDYRQAVDALHPVRLIANQFGGSHAQRDVIDWTLTEGAIRANLPEVAAALAHERAALKPHSPINREFLRRAGRLATV